MPPVPLIDPSTLDLGRPVRDIEDIRRHNRQRFEMEMLSGIVHLDMDKGLAVGFKELSEEDFWVRGHIPGRPILPGVLQIEAAAQLTSYYFMESIGNPPDTFIGFMGVDGVKFRGFVTPEDTLVVAAKPLEIRTRRCKFYCQEFVGEKMVFEGTVLGAPM
jgi:3-hydroxyacyl-[acyl-carrier-protein] dehydratase